jgi:hypothetical protein
MHDPGTLRAELLDAQVDYCCTQDLHEFLITREGLTHEVGFTELVLQLKEFPTSSRWLPKLAEEIKASSERARSASAAVPSLTELERRRRSSRTCG